MWAKPERCERESLSDGRRELQIELQLCQGPEASACQASLT